MDITIQANDEISVHLRIIFWKTRKNHRRYIGKRELIDTTCRIYEVKDNRFLTELVTVIARQNPLDNYNKIIGKKIAFARALAKISYGDGCILYEALQLRRCRQHLWNVFHQTFGLEKRVSHVKRRLERYK